jgi:hypothetical protein
MFQGIGAMMVSGGSAAGASAIGYYRALTVDHTQVPSTQTDFPVLVDITNATLKSVANGGHVRSATGLDILFYTSSAKTGLMKFERDFYDPATGHIVAWVKVSSLSSVSDNVFYMFYGNATDTTDQSDAVNVWDANFLGVWHLGNGTSLSLSDSTTNANTLVNTGSVGATSGQINGAAGVFNGTSQGLSTTNNIDLTGANPLITLQMWVDWSAYASNDDLLAEFTTNFNSGGGFLVDPNDAGGNFALSMKMVSSLYNGAHFTRPASGMKHFVFTFDPNLGTGITTNAYVNGVAQTMTQDTSGLNQGDHYANAKLYIMCRAAASLFGAGTLDEVRLSNVIRTANWVTAEYNNQKTGTTFLGTGSEIPL